MSNNKDSIDGFIPRRPGNRLGELHQVKNPGAVVKPIDRSLHTGAQASTRRGSKAPAQMVGQARTGREIGRIDLEESLRSIDDETIQDDGKKSRRQRRKDKKALKKPKSKARRIVKWVIIALLIIMLAVVGFFIYKGSNASNNVLQGNIFDLVQHEPLKQDQNGRSNFLIVGTSEDDPGHEGANLTDSILVLSVDQNNKNAYTFSIPRDLEVQYGTACLSGYRGKVNVYFSCSNDGDDAASEQDRLTKTREFIGGVVGMDIQYAVHVNYTVMRDVINAIGGNITVNIESRDPRGQMDSNFDWKCGPNYAKRKIVCPPSGHFIDYPNGPAVLDAEHALYLAQARGDIAPTYGFEQSNFDRERNQQKIIVAIREKALSAGTLTNLGAVTGLVDALGSNLRTNIETKEIRTLMDLAQNIKTADIQSIDLASADEPIFNGTGNPAAGLYNFSQLRAYLAKKLTSDPVVREAADITVLNGSGVAGAGQTVADSLKAKKYTIDEVSNAPEGTYEPIEIYQIGTGNTATAAKLKELYNVTIKTTAPPVAVTGSTDFVIIVGKVPAAAQ